MTTSIGTRTRNGLVKGASCNMSRRSVNSYRPKDSVVVGTDISFTNATSTIASAGSAFGSIQAGQLVRVKGSPLNSRDYQVVTASAAAITVLPAVITDEVAGASITVEEV
jgi:hypothetical protein